MTDQVTATTNQTYLLSNSFLRVETFSVGWKREGREWREGREGLETQR